MKHEIMQRIEQIRRGEVPEGYKSGSIGIVPVGWSKTVLHEVIKDLLSGTSVNSDVTNDTGTVSYTHLRAHETPEHRV